MADETVTMTEIHRSRLDFIAHHGEIYLATGGVEGHIVDLRRDAEVSPHRLNTCLLLQTVGRKSGTRRSVPLIYGIWDGQVVIIASKGGADVNPAWYLNLQESSETRIQIATQAFTATWREPEGEERETVWGFMEGIYPPYALYRVGTTRTIPLIMISPGDEIPVFTE